MAAILLTASCVSWYPHGDYPHRASRDLAAPSEGFVLASSLVAVLQEAGTIS